LWHGKALSAAVPRWRFYRLDSIRKRAGKISKFMQGSKFSIKTMSDLEGLSPEDGDTILGRGVPAGPVAPVGDGPLVEAEGGDDGLDRAAVAEQR
jgi:hypothetical protein